MNERRVSFEIKKLNNMIARKICENIKEDKSDNISHIQARILKYLFDNKDATIFQNNIEKEIDVRRSTVSGILKTMEKNKLIIRKDSNFDARKKEISLTNYSIKKHNEIKKKVSNFETNLLKGISYEEKELFLNVIDKLKDNLK